MARLYKMKLKLRLLKGRKVLRVIRKINFLKLWDYRDINAH